MSTIQFVSGCALGALSGVSLSKSKRQKQPSLSSAMVVAMGSEASVIESLNMQAQTMHDAFAAFPAMETLDLFDVAFTSDFLAETVELLDAAITGRGLLAQLGAQKSDLYRITRDQSWTFEVFPGPAGTPKISGIFTHRAHGAQDRNAPFATYALGPVAITKELCDMFLSPLSEHFWKA